MISVGKNHGFDLDVLLRTRLLIQANSGKGKSWLLRRLAEQLFGKVQIIIIDPEGEFATLREKFGYVLVGKGGETPADPRSAALVAHKLLELNASAVADLYEMKPSERHRWVKLFLDALIDAPKSLWHPVVIILDEAHVYCPEKGAGESEASESVISLATRGRKRGYCLIPATQRLGKFRKDAAAEMLNVAIGGTFIDIDRKRAADALGVYGAETNKFFDEIRMLERGWFYMLGPAISTERVLVQVGPVQTTHPEAGSARHAAEPPPAPDKIKALLPKLADLPREAEAKAKTEAELRAEIRGLKQELSRQVSEHIDPAAMREVATLAASKAASDRDAEWEKQLRGVRGMLMKSWEKFVDEIMGALHPGDFKAPPIERPKLTIPALPAPRQVVREPRVVSSGAPLPSGEVKILTACAQYPNGVFREQLTVLTAFKRSTRDAYIQRLGEKGYVSVHQGKVFATNEGVSALGNFEPLPTGIELQEYWLNKLPEGEAKILRILIESYPNAVDREELSNTTGYARSSRDAYIQRMSAKQLVESIGRGQIKASEELF